MLGKESLNGDSTPRKMSKFPITVDCTKANGNSCGDIKDADGSNPICETDNSSGCECTAGFNATGSTSAACIKSGVTCAELG